MERREIRVSSCEGQNLGLDLDFRNSSLVTRHSLLFLDARLPPETPPRRFFAPAPLKPLPQAPFLTPQTVAGWLAPAIDCAVIITMISTLLIRVLIRTAEPAYGGLGCHQN
ncbi:hypothetical protein Y5S_01326 [Alcanivorax nanhaiticus]|uniref:Uncharacterized protein n=1 Tax=Alcanivorax nanhaiticus TaxID=1177154 RepID=A0A095TSQ2_9GAMM|nr:hypothetical protein Y5S_01326 [Alcanivorax nanhaiticus]